MLLPIQEIKLSTKNKRLFFVHLEKWDESNFECKLAAINLGPNLTANASFGPFAKGTTALAAYEALVTGLRSALDKLDPTDSIEVVNNLCNTEFVTALEQQQVLGPKVVVQVNGVDV